MPYVRKHGNQVAIVHGERDATGQVQQRVLFTLYTKAEAEAAIGLRATNPPLSLRGLVESRNEGVRFDWPKIEAAIASLKDDLPEAWDYPTSGVAPMLREGVVGLTRALFAADPQSVFSAGAALRAQRPALQLLRDLIDSRLRLVDLIKEGSFNRDNEFGWKVRVAGKAVPVEAEEWLDGLEQRGEDDKAEALASLLVEVWPEFADGYNKLGLIALERGQYDQALLWFARTMEIGRTLFPKRIAKSRWWVDHDTRPYIRGMRNTALTLLWCGRYDEVLPWCDRLESECFDVDAAALHRGSALLNLGRWRESREAVERYVEIWPEEDFLAAFASFELGEYDDALARWLHAAIQRPRSARMLTGGTTRARPKGRQEVEDHNGGVHRRRDLARYLKRTAARRFFAAITSAPEVVALVNEREAAVRAREAERGEDRSAYDRMMEMATSKFARQQATRLRHLAGA
jgi:tetratricopeptide (TPR) repeat protein